MAAIGFIAILVIVWKIAYDKGYKKGLQGQEEAAVEESPKGKKFVRIHADGKTYKVYGEDIHIVE